MISRGLYCPRKHWALIVLAFASNPATERSDSDPAVVSTSHGRAGTPRERRAQLYINLPAA